MMGCNRGFKSSCHEQSKFNQPIIELRIDASLPIFMDGSCPHDTHHNQYCLLLLCPIWTLKVETIGRSSSKFKLLVWSDNWSLSSQEHLIDSSKTLRQTKLYCNFDKCVYDEKVLSTHYVGSTIYIDNVQGFHSSRLDSAHSGFQVISPITQRIRVLATLKLNFMTFVPALTKWVWTNWTLPSVVYF